MTSISVRVGVVCEGATETEFVRSCLAPHLQQYAILQIVKNRSAHACTAVHQLGNSLLPN